MIRLFFILICIQTSIIDFDVPVVFSDFGVTIRHIDKLEDTINYNKNETERFKFVFYDRRGRSYCEYYKNNKLYQKGFFENSLDTLSMYVSSRNSRGKTSQIKVWKYFEPLKNGDWFTYDSLGMFTENYNLGIREK